MSKKIFCVYFQCKMQKLNYKVYPGNIGEIIYNHISKKAWMQWLIYQTKLINEKKLNMTKEKDISFLEQEMINFLFKNNNF
ncbi:oxidative damage protection protein [Enterobacteriaceae endosymbiont of Donacia bicoloricornis]|uniref:oxidative damage protection protein n=1 Tax=Enterobacteriaceae endosymbiont of Donacia bicoloricornis TaxID=2675772 RepID=UPI001449FD62|nr:oxidative damage protection protein [Enterobacteriaceae endosymbiont of Donacia bicoloricornis]QJC37802.1 oxidative damage protection protein [Enterobacteriaceae endosymbiont of Donacia bicoloricornis]